MDQIVKTFELLGPPPANMIQAGTKGLTYFKPARDGSGFELREPKAGGAPRSLHDILGCESGGPDGEWLNKPAHAVSDYLQLKDLILKMLTYDPSQRITPLEALSHDFFATSEKAEVQTDAATAQAPASSGDQSCGNGAIQ